MWTQGSDFTFLFLNSDTVFCNSSPEEFAKIWPIERTGIRKKKFAIVRFCRCHRRNYWSSLSVVQFQTERGWIRVRLLWNKQLETHIECFHMTSRRPYWCPKTMKRRPCWCPKPVLWELNSFLMQTLSFVPINLHRCWPREWKPLYCQREHIEVSSIQILKFGVGRLQRDTAIEKLQNLQEINIDVRTVCTATHTSLFS